MNSLFVYAIIGAVAIFLFSPIWEEDEFRMVHRAVLHNSQRDMVIYDKNHYGFVSFSKYGLFQYADSDSFGDDVRLLAEEHFNASDANGDGALNLAEFKDFLHPADSNNPKLKQWLSKEDVRESDTDRDGKVSFIEFAYALFDLEINYDEESYYDSHHSDVSMDAFVEAFFNQLDGYLLDIELLSIIGNLHPSGHYYAMKSEEYLVSEAQDDREWRLDLTDMGQYAYTLYDAIFLDELF